MLDEFDLKLVTTAMVRLTCGRPRMCNSSNVLWCSSAWWCPHQSTNAREVARSRHRVEDVLDAVERKHKRMVYACF